MSRNAHRLPANNFQSKMPMIRVIAIHQALASALRITIAACNKANKLLILTRIFREQGIEN
jgi:hypothetical protein